MRELIDLFDEMAVDNTVARVDDTRDATIDLNPEALTPKDLWKADFRYPAEVMFHLLDFVIFARYGKYLPFHDIVKDINWLKAIHSLIDQDDTLGFRNVGVSTLGGKNDVLKAVQTGYLKKIGNNIGLTDEEKLAYNLLCDKLPSYLNSSNKNSINTESKFTVKLMENILSLYNYENNQVSRSVHKFCAIGRLKSL